MMRTCKITVLKKTVQPELIEEYGVDGFGPCKAFEEGQTFITTDTKIPKGFCDDAWLGIRPYVFALAHGDGKNLFYRDSWIRKPDVAICSCNDGLRPVLFKVEVVDE